MKLWCGESGILCVVCTTISHQRHAKNAATRQIVTSRGRHTREGANLGRSGEAGKKRSDRRFGAEHARRINKSSDTGIARRAAGSGNQDAARTKLLWPYGAKRKREIDHRRSEEN